MSDDDVKKAAARFGKWKKPTADAVGTAGASQDVVRKALAINPELKGDKSTRELFDEVKEARAGSAPAAAKPAKARDPKPLPKMALQDLAAVMAATEAWEEDELARISDAEAALAEREALLSAGAITEQIRGEVEAAFRKFDPALKSPKTRALVEQEAAFFKSIGFKVTP
ncbi:MAG: hypothetical protein IT381_01415 [Deltaproteobacteria bacterium]|nr:hypothetical protein [Deltaproteobacteria bacterium]